jgi:hypothetical protein
MQLHVWSHADALQSNSKGRERSRTIRCSRRASVSSILQERRAECSPLRPAAERTVGHEDSGERARDASTIGDFGNRRPFVCGAPKAEAVRRKRAGTVRPIGIRCHESPNRHRIVRGGGRRTVTSIAGEVKNETASQQPLAAAVPQHFAGGTLAPTRQCPPLERNNCVSFGAYYPSDINLRRL